MSSRETIKLVFAEASKTTLNLVVELVLVFGYTVYWQDLTGLSTSDAGMSSAWPRSMYSLTTAWNCS